MYVIRDSERTTDEAVSWWKPNRRGYTYNLNEAGIYTEVDAIKICRNAMRKEHAYVKTSLKKVTGQDGTVSPTKLDEKVLPVIGQRGVLNSTEVNTDRYKRALSKQTINMTEGVFNKLYDYYTREKCNSHKGVDYTKYRMYRDRFMLGELKETAIAQELKRLGYTPTITL